MLRDGRDADAADVIALIGACWAEYPGCVMDLDGEVPELRALASHAAGRGGAMWVWEDAGRVAGVVCTWPRDGGDWELAKMYVAAHLRGRGAAGALIAAAEGHARAGGAARMQLWSDTRFDRAHRFYEKHSYVRHGPLRVLGDRSNSIEFAYAKPLTGAVVAPLDAAAALAAVAPLALVLTACVAAGAAVSFMAPLAAAKARAFWREVARGVARGERYLFAAWLEGTIVGTVQLVLIQKESQPHRAEIEKMLVHPDARRRGLGRRLLAAAEEAAAASGRWLLTLDTGPRGGAGERLYRAAGWEEAGTIPCSSLSPDGSFCDTTFFYKRLLQPTPAAGGTLPAAASG